MNRYKLAVDVAGLQLISKKVRIPLVAPAVGSVFAPVGIQSSAVEEDLMGVGCGSDEWMKEAVDPVSVGEDGGGSGCS